MASKECKHPTCSGEHCRREKKPTQKKKLIRKISKKRQRNLGEEKLLSKKDKAFFSEIWEEREHRDYETDEPIIEEVSTRNFHHVLEKDPYPQFRYEKWNIVLVKWETHDKVHRNIDLTPRIKQLKQKLIKQHL